MSVKRLMLLAFLFAVSTGTASADYLFIKIDIENLNFFPEVKGKMGGGMMGMTGGGPMGSPGGPMGGPMGAGGGYMGAGGQQFQGGKQFGAAALVPARPGP